MSLYSSFAYGKPDKPVYFEINDKKEIVICGKTKTRYKGSPPSVEHSLQRAREELRSPVEISLKRVPFVFKKNNKKYIENLFSNLPSVYSISFEDGFKQTKNLLYILELASAQCSSLKRLTLTNLDNFQFSHTDAGMFFKFIQSFYDLSALHFEGFCFQNEGLSVLGKSLQRFLNIKDGNQKFSLKTNMLLDSIYASSCITSFKSVFQHLTSLSLNTNRYRTNFQLNRILISLLRLQGFINLPKLNIFTLGTSEETLFLLSKLVEKKVVSSLGLDFCMYTFQEIISFFYFLSGKYLGRKYFISVKMKYNESFSTPIAQEAVTNNRNNNNFQFSAVDTFKANVLSFEEANQHLRQRLNFINQLYIPIRYLENDGYLKGSYMLMDKRRGSFISFELLL
eukprot:snap_masked-scaffold_5-processed-gene-5.31-mRNA-1 protein AED:1.00 eAED:1.00 QI:0/0/0/0/1/1/2/0/395